MGINRRQEVELILEEALGMEKKAEENCDKILEQLKANGFHDKVEKIRNDEAIHQTMVKKLIDIIKK